MSLLHEARAAGLEVHADADRLVIRGPSSAEAIALKLLAHKADLLQLLAAPPKDATEAENAPAAADTTHANPCAQCGSQERWRWLDGRQICRSCLMHGNEPIVAVKVWSEVLEAAIWVIADDLPREKWPADAPVYKESEVKLLMQTGPKNLEWVHVTKMMFAARIIDGRKRHHWRAPNGNGE
jgi:Zinc-finger of RNA-polymerase I-specific TFIIB, Rrn7